MVVSLPRKQVVRKGLGVQVSLLPKEMVREFESHHFRSIESFRTVEYLIIYTWEKP